MLAGAIAFSATQLLSAFWKLVGVTNDPPACLNNPGELNAVKKAAAEFYTRFFGCDISGLLGQMFPAELESLTK